MQPQPRTIAPPMPGHGIRPPLGQFLVWIGLGVVLGSIVSSVLFVVGGGMEAKTPGWVAVALIALAIGVGGGAIAFSAYRQSTRIQWWHLLLAAFGTSLFLHSLNRATDLGLFAVIAGLVSFAGLISLIVGGIMAAVQASKEPTPAPTGPLAAPIVGHTADGQPVYGAPIHSQRTNVFAILALVFGILGGLLALVFGHIALSQIRRTGESGRGMAIAGLVLGYISIVFWLVILLIP